VRAGRSSSKPRAGIAEMKQIEMGFCDCIDWILTRCGIGCNWCAINNKKHFGRLGKQLYRLPNMGLNIITDVGLDEASPYSTVLVHNFKNIRKRYGLFLSFLRLGLDHQLKPSYRLWFVFCIDQSTIRQASPC
jgi:hypothetical protein